MLQLGLFYGCSRGDVCTVAYTSGQGPPTIMYIHMYVRTYGYIRMMPCVCVRACVRVCVRVCVLCVCVCSHLEHGLLPAWLHSQDLDQEQRLHLLHCHFFNHLHTHNRQTHTSR